MRKLALEEAQERVVCRRSVSLRASLITNLTTTIGFMVFFFVEAPLLQDVRNSSGTKHFDDMYIDNGSAAYALIFSSVVIQISRPSMCHLSVCEYCYRLSIALLTDTKRAVLLVGGLLVAVAIYGASLVETNRYMRDDISSAEEVIRGIRFFEKHLTGVIPLEIVIHD